MNEHAKRWITGLIGTPLIIGFVLYSSNLLFALLIILLIQLSIKEFNRLVFTPEQYREKMVVVFFSLLLSVVIITENFILISLALQLIVFLSFIFFLLTIREGEIHLERLGKMVLGVFYLPFSLSFLVCLRTLPQGIKWVFLVLVIIFCGDTVAFYVGKLWGKHKLIPIVSPNKTVEGAIGYIIGCFLGGLVFYEITFQELSFSHLTILCIAGAILGQLGDLCESALKRAAGVKNAGSLFPGHGGILDRIDSLIFFVPFVFYYHYFFIDK